MDQKRLEEFRRRLRAGEVVEVERGEVRLASEEKPRKKTESRPAIRVKPHEWGAGLTSTSSGQRRVLTEQALLRKAYPGWVVDVDDDGLVFAHGSVGPTESLKSSYHLLVELPPGYGQGMSPSVYVLAPPFRGTPPHIYNDGSLCLDHTGAFTGRSTLLTLLAWTSVWLVLYEGWLESGTAW